MSTNGNVGKEEGTLTSRDVTHQLIVTSQRHRRVTEQCFKETGVHRAQHRVLMFLACDKFRSQVDLAKKLEVTPATVAVALKTLERDGLVVKTAGEKDSRANFVELTEKGRKVVDRSKDYFDYVDRMMYRGFTEDELKTLHGFLSRIYDNVEEIEITDNIQKQRMEGKDETV